MQGHMSFESGVTYNRGGCTLKHCWEKISDPSMEDRLQRRLLIELQSELLEILKATSRLKTSINKAQHL